MIRIEETYNWHRILVQQALSFNMNNIGIICALKNLHDWIETLFILLVGIFKVSVVTLLYNLKAYISCKMKEQVLRCVYMPKFIRRAWNRIRL